MLKSHENINKYKKQVTSEINRISKTFFALKSLTEDRYFIAKSDGSLTHITISMSRYVVDIYNCFEIIMVNTIYHYDGININGGKWHQKILDILESKINGRRPRVLEKNTHELLKKIKIYRHKSLNIIGNDLKFELVKENAKYLIEVLPLFAQDIMKFYQYCMLQKNISNEDYKNYKLLIESIQREKFFDRPEQLIKLD